MLMIIVIIVNGGLMKISIEKNVVEFVPENREETDSLDSLWKVLIDCVKDSKKLTPIGEYVPEKKLLARFAIEEPK